MGTGKNCRDQCYKHLKNEYSFTVSLSQKKNCQWLKKNKYFDLKKFIHLKYLHGLC